jgi:hypothetical protein
MQLCCRDVRFTATTLTVFLRRRTEGKILNCNYVSRDIKQLHAGRMLIYCVVLDLYETFYYLIEGLLSLLYNNNVQIHVLYTCVCVHSYIQCLLIKTAASAEEFSFIHQRMLTRINGINQAELCHAVSCLFCCKAGWLFGSGNQWQLYQREVN